MSILRRILPLLLVVTLLCSCVEMPNAAPDPTPVPTAQPTATPESTPAPTPEPTMVPAMASATSNATKDAPDVKDPTTWDDNAAETLASLVEQFGRWGLTLDAKADYPYLLAVNREAGVVTVYTVDAATGQYAAPYMAMVCSAGNDTPTGYYATPVSYSWRLLMGPSYGQYATRIYDGYLFHSVPYYSQHKDDVEYDEFNKLGTVASLGCIRLAVVDVKWIYDNCPLGTPVVIYNDKDPGPMGKPGTIYTDPDDEDKRGWDPTDPDPANPWDDSFESGTAIRSQAAWDQWENEHENWMSSLTPTDLQARIPRLREREGKKEKPHRRGRICPALNIKSDGRLREGCGPGMPGPYKPTNKKAPAFSRRQVLFCGTFS